MFPVWTRYMTPLCTSGIGWSGRPRHRPDPGQPQAPHVRGRDLVQRTVAPALIVPADHQPVSGIRVAEHGVGDRDVVLDLPLDREAAARGRRRVGSLEGRCPGLFLALSGTATGSRSLDHRPGGGARRPGGSGHAGCRRERGRLPQDHGRGQ